MKTWIFILLAGLTLSACHSGKKMATRRAAYAETIPVEVAVHETIQDTVVIEEVPQPAHPEKVVRTQGNDLMRYCVIVGSFITEQNAINLRNNLIRQGFLGTSIMRNDEGMFRVSAGCNNSHEDAWQEVCRLRRLYPQFRDAWLLETNDD